MNRNKQMHAPVYEALERLKRRRVVPFDVPGHKRGRGNPELVELLGEKCVSLDVNSMKPLDNLCHPVSCYNVLQFDYILHRRFQSWLKRKQFSCIKVTR